MTLLLIKYNIYNLIIISAVIHGFIFSAIILGVRKYRITNSRYLAYIVLLISLNNLYYWLIDTQLNQYLEWKTARLYLFPWDLLIMPVYLYFVAGYLDKSHLKRRIYVLPFIIVFIVQLFNILRQLVDPGFFKENVFRIAEWNAVVEYFTIAFVFFLLVKIFAIILSYEKENKSNLNKRNTKWLKQLLFAAIVICSFWTVVLVMDKFIPSISINDRLKYYFIWISMSAVVYWLGYLGIYHLKLFNQQEEIRNKRAFSLDWSKRSSSSRKSERFEEIDAWIKSNKHYLDPNFGLAKVATHFALSEGYVSQLINNSGINFSEYVNTLRLEEAKAMLTNREFESYTIVAIALESGFNSKSAFYKYFRKKMAMSPSEYRKL